MTAAVALFLCGTVTVLVSLELPFGTLHMPGSGFFPLVLGLMLAALAAGHGVQLYLAKPKQPAGVPGATGGAPHWRLDEATRRVLLFMGAVGGATALMSSLGYTLTSFLLMLALLQILGIRGWRHCGLIALSSACACYLVFVRWLAIPLPDGWLGF
ncbi:MAG: tripartite tricarboxylate transporter TctB family protein [Rhodocyclaceae bacterium]|nr:MAG: tripartite tricarboxylate transporter TctB family protein [Rhodocyclaceae bacterium]